MFASAVLSVTVTPLRVIDPPNWKIPPPRVFEEFPLIVTLVDGHLGPRRREDAPAAARLAGAGVAGDRGVGDVRRASVGDQVEAPGAAGDVAHDRAAFDLQLPLEHRHPATLGDRGRVEADDDAVERRPPGGAGGADPRAGGVEVVRHLVVADLALVAARAFPGCAPRHRPASGPGAGICPFWMVSCAAVRRAPGRTSMTRSSELPSSVALPCPPTRIVVFPLTSRSPFSLESSTPARSSV